MNAYGAHFTDDTRLIPPDLIDDDVDFLFEDLVERIRTSGEPELTPHFLYDSVCDTSSLPDAAPAGAAPVGGAASAGAATAGADRVGAARWPHAVAADSLQGLVDELEDNERLLNQQAARKVVLVNRIRHRIESDTGTCLDPERGPKTKPTPGWTTEVIERSQLILEAAVVLKISEGAAKILFHHSRLLGDDLPQTFAALAEGAISYRHATVIADEADSLPVQARAAFDAKLAPQARDMTTAKLARTARVLREKMHPDSIRDRHVRAAADRQVCVEPARDGMARLELLMPVPHAFAIYNRLDDTARTMAGPAEPRTLDQLRVDVATDLLLNGDHSTADPDHQYPSGIVPTVMVVVPALTLLGGSEEPATLEGYGPIDAETARELAGNATSWTRILTHPETGVVLSVGHTQYKVPTPMRRYLRFRDETCRAWGCNRLARNCEVDHTEEWQYGGHTAAENLAHLCGLHHKIKTYTGWVLEQLGGGRLQWTSPLGRVHRTEPANVIGGLDSLIPVRPTDPTDPSEPTAAPVAAPAVPPLGFTGASNWDAPTDGDARTDQDTTDTIKLPF